MKFARVTKLTKLVLHAAADIGTETLWICVVLMGWGLAGVGWYRIIYDWLYLK